MTDEDLKMQFESARQQALKRIQMPPVMEPRKPIKKEISYEPAIQGLHDSKIVVVDISMNVKDRDRKIVVREPDGTLREADWDERDRMQHIFYPRKGKEDLVPQMFQDEYLYALLHKHEFSFILDRACCQFEPDDPAYIDITEKTYDFIDKEKQYDLVHSTRHFGPLAFYLVTNKKLDNLLQHYITNNRIDEAVDLIALFHIVYPGSRSATSASKLKDNDHFSVIKSYVENDAVNKEKLQLAVQVLEEALHSRTDNENTDLNKLEEREKRSV